MLKIVDDIDWRFIFRILCGLRFCLESRDFLKFIDLIVRKVKIKVGKVLSAKSTTCRNQFKEAKFSKYGQRTKNNLSSPGVDFINVRRTAFLLVGPKSVRIQSSSQNFFTLLGSTSVKAVGRTLMKLTQVLMSSSFYAQLLRMQIPNA